MFAIRRQTRIEFFGGPCDGHQRVVGCRIEDLEPTTMLPVPFVTERRWLRPAWMLRAKSQAIYALDRSPGQLGYRYLGLIPHKKRRQGACFSRLLCWLRGVVHRRGSPPRKSNYVH